MMGGRRFVSGTDGNNLGDCTSGQTALCTGVWAFEEAAGVGGSQGAWSELTSYASTGQPSMRDEHSLVHPPGTGRTVLFGGATGVTLLGDTWRWDGSNWSQLSTPTSPAARDGHQLYWDDSLLQAILVGGKDDRSFDCDIPGRPYCEAFWQFNPAGTWSATSDRLGAPGETGLPEGRADYGIAFDPANQRLLLAGGVGLAGEFSDAFSYESETWEVSASAPSARRGVAMTWNPAERLAVAFGGQLRFDNSDACPNDTTRLTGFYQGCYRGDTWVWTEATQNWSLTQSHNPMASDRPSPRSQASIIYVPQKEQLVLFAGIGPDCPSSDRCNDIWSYRLGEWRQIVPSDVFGHGVPPPVDSTPQPTTPIGGRCLFSAVTLA